MQRFKSESDGQQHMSDVKDQVLDEIIAGFDRMRASTIRHASITFDVFNAAVREVEGKFVRAHQVAAFAEQSKRYPAADIEVLWGHYVSALASICTDKQSEISTEGFAVFPRYVGAYLKSASLTVIGNVGNSFGHTMRSGKLTLMGNTQWGVGCGMKGGEITIHGNAGSGVGDRMDGTGVIRVLGTYESLGNPILGEIYRGTEKVWPVNYGRRRR